MSKHCYHCGLPIADNLTIEYPVLGETRQFCCHGCQLACKTIVENGFEEFYRHRDSEGGLNAQVLPDILKNLSLYDRPEVQQSFVRHQGNQSQAALILENIRCAACLWLNEQHLRALPGVIDVQLDYTSYQASVTWDNEQIQLSQILEAIAAIGYIAHPYDPVHREQLLESEKHRSIEKMLFSGLLGMQIMGFSIATYWMGGYQPDGQLPLWEIIGRWSTLIVTAVMLVYSGADFFVGAWRDLQQRKLGMDVPIVLGLVAAWGGSLWGTIVHDEAVYFDSIGMFIFFVLLARVFELKGRMAASDKLDRLLRIIPPSTTRLTAEGEENVAVMDLAVGDSIRILAGQTIPVDGYLTTSSALINEAHLTGESKPLTKQLGDWLRAGSISLDQPLTMRVEKTSTHSTTSNLQQLMRHALAQKPAIAQFADRISAPFILLVLAIAFITLLTWTWLDSAQALPNTIAVLIITCPCALALATPVALAISAGRISEIGMTPMSMNALAALPKTDILVLDKTGTLTEGQPRLTEVRLLSDINETDARQIASLLESQSEHPLAYALRNPQTASIPTISQLTHFPSQGIEGMIDGEIWRIGKPEFCTNLALSTDIQTWIKSQQQSGSTIVMLAKAHQAQALFVLCDPLREDAHPFIETLQQSKRFKQIVMLSGDDTATVASVAQQLGLTDFHGGLLPDNKLAWIQQAQQQGHRVLMIGDGINDAPTLAAADVAISFNHASDLAQLHSDLVLMGHQLMTVVAADQLAKRSQHIIDQNLFWALAYNLLAIPFAAFGYITPWIAAIGMSASSLFVVANALRLRR
jgi:P-type Cu2+ transporter